MKLPTYVQMEPVGQCNLRCQMCSIQFRQDGPPYGPPAFMAFDVFTRTLDQLEGLEELHLQGLGEPMMHPRFFEMVNYAARKGIKVSTNSNLTLLTARRAEQCLTSGLDCLHASIDGATAEIYERIRVRAHFDRVVGNLERLIELREQRGYTLPRVRMVMVIMRQNLHELPDLVRMAHRWAVEGLFVQHLCHDFGETNLPERYLPMRDFVQGETLQGEDLQRIEDYFGQARAVADELGVDLRLPRPRPRIHPPGTPGSVRCNWPWRGAYISYQGSMMPCCMISTPDRYTLGNLAAEDFTTAWNGPAYQEFRAQLDSEQPPEVCRSCSIYAGTF